MSKEVSIRTAAVADLPAVRSWLAAAGLPVEDLSGVHMRRFLLAEVDDRTVGMVGIESFGEVGLLRSLVVHRSDRSTGLGRRLVAALESQAVHAGINDLWLLTIDADGYFSRLGYETKDRSDAPDAIRETAEFSRLCPGDAVLMRKCL